MPTLRLKQYQEKENHYRVEIELEQEDKPILTAKTKFRFALIDTDPYDMRWYLEDYLQFSLSEPTPQIAKRIEKRLDEIGNELFELVFQANDDTRERWFAVKDQLKDTRIEIVTEVEGATALPWELIHDPKTDAYLALRAKSFVRTFPNPAQTPQLPGQAEKIRILLVICRPGGRDDVPFRSVASRLLKGLGDEEAKFFELDVLRPPTFEQLSHVLQAAKAQSKPYHIVHFDGHGIYLQSDKHSIENILKQLGALLFSGPREGKHGYLLFENPNADKNAELIDGTSLGKLLLETEVPALVLNACRSAHADALEKPEDEEKFENEHTKVRAFGSLAQEVMDAGVAGVVAMRYNVYVVTAAQFVADLYAALAAGQTLGEAVSLGRKQLAAQPLREIVFAPRPLQDWSVPVVYEAAPISLFPKPTGAGTAPLRIDITRTARPADDLPRPDVGFYGRDETLLALDRAFDTQKVVLLHAYAGSGKTMTAAEFARWYSQTGGLSLSPYGLSPRARGEAGGGPVLFTSFEQYKPLTQVLSTVEQTFRPLLEANNIQWGAMDEAARLNVALQIFKQIPVLWIWDNVEPVSGFPAGAASAWSEAEQRDLKNFLSNMGALTKAKFLLTSRRDESKWLGDLPARVVLPPMPMQERVQLARALAEKQGQNLAAVDDWLPLLRYTLGNPLTLTVVVGQALRLVANIKDDDPQKQKARRAARLNAYLEQLYSGEAAFEDEASEGRTRSLGASLSYGFETAFNEEERKILALLHFFQGFVDVKALRLMLNPEYTDPNTFDWGLGHKDFTDQKGVALLDRAAETGLLSAHGGGYYTIHPALPWFFRSLFAQYYPDDDRPSTADDGTTVHRPPSMVARRAFVESMGELGNYYHSEYQHGNREVIAPLRHEEANLLHARQLALSGATSIRRGAQSKGETIWPGAVIKTMQGLRTLYNHTGRRAEWARLVDEIAPDFVGADDLPLPGREAQWGLVTEYRVRLAQEERNWAEAESLQHKRVEWERRETVPLLARPPEALSSSEKNTLRTLAVSYGQLSDIQREQGKPECVDASKKAIEIYHAIGDFAAEATRAFNLGHAYKDLPGLRDLDEAGRWYGRSLELFGDSDWKGKSGCLHQLGMVSQERLNETINANGEETEILKHLNAAVNFYMQALEITPPDAVDDLAVTHNQLGIIYNNAGDLERAQDHYNESIRYKEMAGNFYGAALTQENIAIAIAPTGRKDDALLYANAAIKNFERYGAGALQAIQKVQRTIEWIKQQ